MLVPSRCRVDGVPVDAEHQAVLLNVTVDEDHDHEGDHDEEEEHGVDGGVSLSRVLLESGLDLHPLPRLEVRQVHRGEARQVGPRHHAPPDDGHYQSNISIFLTCSRSPSR